MANFQYTIDGKTREIRRLTFDELVVMSEVAYEADKQAVVKDRSLIHNIDEALAAVRDRRYDSAALWKYIKSLAGTKMVLEQIDLHDVIDSLTREQALEIVGEACGYTIVVRKETEQVDDRPTSAGSG